MLSRITDWFRFRRSVLAASRGHAAAPGERDVIVIPCWRRAEFLWHCLENLARNDDIRTTHILFRVDTGFSQETLDVIREFERHIGTYEVEMAIPSPFRRTKPSANFLFGILHAAAIAKDFVFLVEEDIMVARDYVRWNRTVQRAAAPLFCSIPVRNPNRQLALPADVSGYYLSSGDSYSNGMCFDKNILRNLVAPHFNMGYLGSPKKYIRRRFPASVIGLGFVEQDGLIRRIQESSPYPIAWPCVPRAFHSGYVGARGGWQNFVATSANSAALRDRVQVLTDTIYSEEAMRKVIDRPEFLETCLPCDLEIPPWTQLHRISVPEPTQGVTEQTLARLRVQ